MRRLLAACLLVLAAAPARAASVSWTGGAVGDWSVGANWSGAAAPGASDDVTIGSAFVVAYATDAALTVNSLTLAPGGVLQVSTGLTVTATALLQSGSALQFGTTVPFSAGTFALLDGSSAAYVGARTAAGTVPPLVLQAGLFSLAGGSTITVSGRGYAGGDGSPIAGFGPGGGGAGSGATGGGGGGHGGAGGPGAAVANQGPSYDAMPPADGGSGGGGAPTTLGGAGGGIVFITASTAAINGRIEADGDGGESISFQGAGGGAGGAVVVTASVLTGTGTISASGGDGGAGSNQGGGGGGGGLIWLKETSQFSVVHTTLTLTTAGGLGGSAGVAVGADGNGGRVFEDPRHWKGGVGGGLASNGANWTDGLVPVAGQRLVFGSAGVSRACAWDLGGISIGSATFAASYSSTVVMTASMTVSGDFGLAGGTVTSVAGTELVVGGGLAQSGGVLDLSVSSLTLAAAGLPVAASFVQARAGTLLIGASTATLSGAFTSLGLVRVPAPATLAMDTATLSIGGGGPFTGGGEVNLTTNTILAAVGTATQTWTVWPSTIASLSVTNASFGGLILSTMPVATFPLQGGLSVSTGASVTALGARLVLGGDWANYGFATLTGSTVAFQAASGTQTVVAGGTFDTLEVGGSVLRFSTWVVAGTSVAVLSGTLDLAASTFSVRGNWAESPGATVRPGASLTIFDGIPPATVLQQPGNSFATFRSSAAGGVSISSTLATTANFEWHRGNLSYPGAALTIGGDMLVKGGILLSPSGSTVVFNGASTQTVTFTSFGDFVDANTGPGGVTLGSVFMNVASFAVRPGSVLNGGGTALTAAGPIWDTSFSTYNAPSPAHSVLWQPASSIAVASGSVVNAKLALSVGKTAVLLGDLTVGGAGSTFDLRTGSTLINATGGSTITFQDSANLAPTAGANWTYGGDAANSWLVFAGSGTARGTGISTNTFGNLRVALNTSADVFKAPNMFLSGHLVVQSGTFRPAGSFTTTVGGDVLQTGGAVDYATVSTGTLVFAGPSTQTVTLQPGAHTLWHVVDASTGTVQAASDLLVRGDFVVSSGTFLAGSGALSLQGGLIQISSGASFSGQASTVTLDGASSGRTLQSLAIKGAASFNGLAINVLTADLLTSATAAVFSDPIAGGTLTVTAGAQLTAADLRLGPPAGARLTARSSAAGSPWYLKATAFSSATAVAAYDSDASAGIAIDANDGRSLDGGGNVHWRFNPVLLVLLPGETFTPSAAPGKSGAPLTSIAGAPVAATVIAVSSRWEQAFTATGTVTLTTDDPFAVLPATAALSNGSAVLSFTPLTAEPSPRATHVTGSTFFGSGISTTSVIPAGLAKLQIILFGETAVPGSPSGRIGLPFARVRSVPFPIAVRAVDSYWNVVTTVTDSYALTTSASTSTLPSPLAFASGLDFPAGLTIYTTGLFTLSVTDLSQPAVQSSTSAVFGVVPPSVSSPTAVFYVPTGASIATLGGLIAGTAADSASVSRVRVDVREVETGFHYDGVALAFSAAAPIYTTTTLASPLSASTSWSSPVPDGALTDGRHYAATALVDDPSGFVTVAASTFAVDRSALLYGSRSGQGTATVAPSTAAGCALLVTTVTFTTGSSGIGPGGAVALRLPDGWTTPAGTSASNPPPAGFWRVGSTSTAIAPGVSTATVNPASFGAQALGSGWVILKVATSAGSGFLPGQNILFEYTGLPPLSPAGHGAQTFSLWTAADASAPLAPISTQPAVSLTTGTALALAFSDSTPLILSPLQSAPTMQLKVADLCGNDNLGASSGTVSLSLVVPIGGAFVTDASAVFRALNGAPITSIAISSGVAFTSGFTVATATSGPSLAYVRAAAAFSNATSSSSAVALRPARLVSSAASFSSVSVDSGTLTPGATSVALSGTAPDAYGARVVFTLPDPAAAWDAAASLDGVNFSSPVFLASGFGDASGPVFLTWDGVDRVSSPPRYARAGHYRIRLRAGGGAAIDKTLEIVVSTTAAYAGRLGAGGAGASVSAVGPGAGDGAFAQASATGYFLLSGLRAGQAYQLLVATATSVGGMPVTLSTAVAGPAAARPSVDLGTVTLPSPARVRVAAGLPIPSPFEAVGGFVGRAADGSAAFSGALRFSTAAASSDDGGPLFGRAASTWSAVLAQPGVYTVEIDVPDLRLSTAIANISLSTSGFDLAVTLDKRANVSGRAILPFPAAGTTISVQATKAGASAPAAFGAALATSSGSYALYGLDTGTWTVRASAPGYLPVSTDIVVADTNDVTGLDLTLGAGGTIVGTVTVTGDSRAAAQCFPGTGGAAGACPAGTFDVAIEALASGTLDRASARVRLTGGAVSASAPYAITGLPPGLWTLRTALPGFSLSPAGGVAVAVAGAGTSTSAVALAAADARLAVTVNLAPLAGGACRAPSAWAALGVSVDGADGSSRVYGDAAAAGGGSFETVHCSSATFFSPALPPGPARVAAAFKTSGAWAVGRALLTDGATAPLTLDLTASSAPASGLLSLAGIVSVATRTPAGAPFTVAATSAAGVLSAAPGVSFCLLGFSNPVVVPALRAELIPYDAADGDPAKLPPLRRAPGASCAAVVATSSSPGVALAYAAPVNADGSFNFAPGVPAGTYVLRVPGNLDDDAANGDEAAPWTQLAAIGAGGITFAPRLGRGARVSGALSAPASLAPGRLFHVALMGADGREARSADVAPPPGAAASFSFDGVADGRYVLSATDFSSPRAYASVPLAVTVAGSDVAGLAPSLAPAGTVRARLALARTLPDGSQDTVLITRDNAGLLAPGFTASAAAAPAIPGGAFTSRLASDGSLVDAQGRIVIDGVAPGTYDVAFAAPAGADLGAGAIALAPATVAGVSVPAGQAVDLGVIALFAGSFVSGRVADAAGAPVAGVRVAARASASGGAAPGAAAASLSALTDAGGRYLIRGLDPARRYYDVTAAPRGQLLSGAPLPPYAPSRALGVDVSSGAVQDFVLRPAPGSITGRVSASNGAALASTLGPGDPALPGAALTLQQGGVAPSDDPLADLALRTNPDGSFAIPAVASGTYRLTATALGLGSAARSIVVSTSAANIGTIALGGGGLLSGAIRLPDGSFPSADEVQAVVAAAPDSSEFLYGALSADPSGGVSGYQIGGLTPGRTYRVVVAGPGGAAYAPPETAAVVLASTSDLRTADIVLRPAPGPVSFRARRSGSSWRVEAKFPRPVRSRLQSDSDPALLLSTFTAAGVLSGGALSADRLTVTADYAPGPAETSAVFRASAPLAATDWSSTDPSSRELIAGATASLALAGDAVTRASALNGLGATLTFDGDAGRLVLPRGAFAVDAATAVTVSFTRSDAASAFAAGAPPAPRAGPYYDASVPAGVPSLLRRPVELTLSYSTSVADPSRLNAYWYNPAAGSYILQPDVLGAAPVVDRAARTYTFRVGHFSTYVLLDSAAGAIGGSPFAGGELDAYNFPNPFDLSVKTVTTIHGGGTPSVRGTLVRVSVPAGLAGGGTLRVFDITGRSIRTIDLGRLTGGQVYYQGWDGRNDSGVDVASGLYLGQVEVAGRRKTFKMAVLK